MQPAHKPLYWLFSTWIVAARNQNHIKTTALSLSSYKYATLPLWAGKKYIKLPMSRTVFLRRL